MAAHFGAGILPPFSFTYGDRSSVQFLQDWQFSHESRSVDAGRTEHVFTYTDPETQFQLRCECSLFAPFPAIEWVVKRKNGGANETPILENFQALDATFARKEKGDLILHRAL